MGSAPPPDGGDRMASSPHDALELFFDSSSDLIAILDWEGRLLLLNPAWNRIFGYRVEDLLGRRFVDLVHPDDREPPRARRRPPALESAAL